MRKISCLELSDEHIAASEPFPSSVFMRKIPLGPKDMQMQIDIPEKPFAVRYRDENGQTWYGGRTNGPQEAQEIADMLRAKGRYPDVWVEDYKSGERLAADLNQGVLGVDPKDALDTRKRNWRSNEIPQVGSQWVAPKHLWGNQDVPFEVVGIEPDFTIRVKPIGHAMGAAVETMSFDKWQQFVREGVIHHMDDWPAFADWRQKALGH